MTQLDRVLDELVTANRILAREEVVDSFGHVSARHPERADRYLLSRARASTGSPSSVNSMMSPVSMQSGARARDRRYRSGRSGWRALT